MNKKKNLLALALSVSFVFASASISHAEEEANLSPQAKEEAQALEKAADEALIAEQEEPPAEDVEENTEEKAPLTDDSNEDIQPIEVSEIVNKENVGEADQLAPFADNIRVQESTDKNYSKDEKEIKDYSESERYKETDLQPGNANQENYATDEKKEKDGLKFELSNPSADSPSKTEYGYQITIDKKTGQRTYTKIYVTDSGLLPVNPGEKPMMGEGDKLTSESPGVTYKPGEDSSITASRQQRNLNYEASEDTLKHINNKDNLSTSFGMKDNYAQENPGVKFFGSSFALGYKVNPWPNENDRLEELKLNKNNYDPTSKFCPRSRYRYWYQGR